MNQASGSGVWDESGPGDEHGPRGKSDMSTSHETYQPTDKEEKAIKLVMKKFQEAKKERGKHDEHWLKWYKMFRGKQWTEQRPTYRHTEVINKIFQMIQSQVPQMVDTRPRVNYLAQEPNDQPMAELFNAMFTADWERQGWFNQLVELLYDGHFYGTGIMEVGHDEEADYGRGRVVLKSYDPFWTFPDPMARDFNNECEFLVTAEPKTVARVRRENPKVAKYISADMHNIIGGDRQDFGKVRFKSPVDNRVTIENESPEEWANDNKVLEMTLMIRSKDVVEEKDEESGNYVQKLKYPKGRTIKVANGVLLSDEEKLPYGDDKFPFARWCNYMLPREFWGQSEVEQLEGPQKTFNKLISFVLDVLTLMGNPVWICDFESQVDTDNLFNRPGLVIEKAKGSEVRREEGTQLQPYILNLIQMFGTWFDEVGGSQDVSRGAAPAGITAMGAIEALQQAAHTRIRQKMRNMDITLNQIGQMYMARALEFYTAPQVFRITNDDNSMRYFSVAFAEKEIDGKTVKIARLTDYELDPTGQKYKELPVKELIMNGLMDTRASAGSGLPFAMAEKEDKLLRLFDRGIIDTEEVLRGIDHPNWEAVLQRITEKQAAQAQAQAQPA